MKKKKRKRRAITCPSHNPIIVSKNQSAPEKKTKNPRKQQRHRSTAPGYPYQPWGSSWEEGLKTRLVIEDGKEVRGNVLWWMLGRTPPWAMVT
jgi:hypothetical protein